MLLMYDVIITVKTIFSNQFTCKLFKNAIPATLFIYSNRKTKLLNFSSLRMFTVISTCQKISA